MRSRFILLFFLLGACGARGGPVAEGTSAAVESSDDVKMRHQILFQNGDDTQVFEGVMIRRKDAYIVRAFAGPGVDLFTVARSGNRRREILHIGALSDKIDVAKIGEDIFCIYMDGCAEGKIGEGPGEGISCVRDGMRLTEIFSPSGDLVERRFPDAHGIGLTVRYSMYKIISGRYLPARIELRWGNAARSLTIQTVTAERIRPSDGQVIEKFLESVPSPSRGHNPL